MPEGVVQFPPPSGLVNLLLSGDQIVGELPEIKTYATRPVFDREFSLCGPGWHPESGILVQGIDISVSNYEIPDPRLPAIERLPYHLRRLLGGFPFRDAADVANTLLAFLTGLVANLFVAAGKGLLFVDANQPALGKTWLARILGIVLDGRDPQLVTYTQDDAELAKQVCATLRTLDQSILIVDNARPGTSSGCINSTFLEANSLASIIALRILGRSENFTRPNDILWCLTMNGTQATPDLVSRSFPVRLHFDGDPANRPLPAVDPIRYAHDQRNEIIAELASMVLYWKQQGCPEGTTGHRCTSWAKICGGIVASAGFPEVLTNLGEAATEFDAGQDELAALAEAVLRQPGFVANITAIVEPILLPQPALSATGWESYFKLAKVLEARLTRSSSQRSKVTMMGNHLKSNVGRTVIVDFKGRDVRATLRKVDDHSNRTTYVFEFAPITCQDTTTNARPNSTEPPTEPLSGLCSPQECDATRRAPDNPRGGP